MKLSTMPRKLSLFVIFLTVTGYGLCQSVDPLTGRAQIGIPIGKISALDLTVSVGLSHHGGALQVNEGPGNAGMGWSVDMGGSVSREVRNLPDDYSMSGDARTGWLANTNANATLIQNFTPAGDTALVTCSTEVADYNFINNLGYTKDSEPDVFYFRAPGLSGKFVFGSDGLPKLIPYQDVQITYSPVANSTTIASFTIKTNKGIVYTFGSAVNVTRQTIEPANPIVTTNYMCYGAPLVYTSTWNLTSIQSNVSGALANFTYQATPLVNGATFASRVNSQNRVDTLYFLQETVIPQRLTQVSLKNFSINISWANNLVDKISINESETGDSQEFDFAYRSVTSSSDTGFPKIAKPFLAQVRQQNSSTCVGLPSYKFVYAGIDTSFNPVNIPWRTGYGEDFFGYYNGQDNNQNTPTLYYYQTKSGAKRYRVTPLPAHNATTILNAPTGTDMVPHSTYTGFGAVSQIQFPTGGTTTFTYEPNKYWDNTTGEELVGPGVRVASVTTFGGEVAFGKTSGSTGFHSITKNYQYLSGSQTSGLINYPPSFGYTDGTNIYRMQFDWGNGAQVFYSRTTESVSGQGYREYLFTLPHFYPDSSTTSTRSRIARPSGSSCSNTLLKYGPYSFPFGPLKDIAYMKGLPTSVTDYDASGNITYQKTMTYAAGASGTIVKGLRYEPTGNFFQYSLYNIPVNESRLLTQEVVKTYSEATPASFSTVTTSYQYNSNNLVSQSTVTNGDGSVGKSFVKYAKDFNTITAPAGGDQQANAIYKLNTNNRTAEMIETYSTFQPSGGTEALSGAQLMLYKDYGTYVWPYQTLSFVQGVGGLAPSNTVTSTSFTADPNFKVKGAVMEFVNGLPINQTDPITKIVAGTHYATGTATPLATFANCKAENAVYEGFEQVQDKGLTFSGTGVALQSSGWTGKKSLQFGITNSTVTSTSTVTKRGNSYRVSCWFYAAQNSTLTVQAKNGSTVQSSVVLNYTTPNQWKYLEAFMDMTAVSSSFTLQLVANATIQIDDFVAMPKQARVSYSSYMPLTGVTAQTDDRGNSSKVDFDSFGRPIKSYDRQRNLKEVREYVSQRKGRIELSANFTTNVTQYVVGQNATFTAPSTCLTPVTYAWTITDFNGTQVTGTASSISYSFQKYGTYSVALTVSTTLPGYTSISYSEDICVTFPNNLGVNIQVTGSATMYFCDPVGSGTRTFTAVVQGINAAVMLGLPVQYTWYVSDDNLAWTPATDLIGIEAGLVINGNVFTRNITGHTYYVTCVVKFGSPSTSSNIPNSTCNLQEAIIAPGSSAAITFVNNSPCQ